MPITGTSSLLRTTPPLSLPYWYFCPCGSTTWRFPLSPKRQILTFRTKSLCQCHAASMPGAALGSKQVSPKAFIPRKYPIPRFWPPILSPFDTLNGSSLSFISLDTYLTCYPRLFALTLTTRAFDPCGLRWFETNSCKSVSRGLPSSLV